MVDTVRTQADLLANLFQDGQAANAITAQDCRDLIVSVMQVGGWADYNDATTSGTPISITGGAGYTDLTNDGAGTNSQNRFVHPSITDIWDTANDQFDFTELELYDEILMRVDLTVTTTSANQVIDVALELASGDAAEFDLLMYNNGYKTAGAQPIKFMFGWYIGNSAVLNNPGKIKVKSDSNCTVVVNGWYVRVTKN